jgi:hypothetical protein
MSVEKPTKAAVSITEMARMVGLSRARFYQLQKAGFFPKPERDAESGRPFYTEKLQQVCLDVRSRNLGVNGKTIVFYSRRPPLAPARPRKAPNRQAQHADLINSLQALGLTSVTPAQMTAAVKELYPRGTSGVDEAEVVRSVFLQLRRQHAGG